MASLAAAAASLGKKAITIATSKLFVPITGKYFHGSSRKEASVYDKAKQKVDEAKNVVASAYEKAVGMIEEDDEKIKAMGEEIEKKKEEIKKKEEEVKKDLENMSKEAKIAWDKAKDTAGSIKDAMVEKSWQTKDSIKNSVKSVKRRMNTKDKPNN